MSEELFYPAAKELVKTLTTIYKDWPEGRKQFKGTSDRLARMYTEFCWTPSDIKYEVSKQFRVFDQTFDEMLVQKNVHVWTLCPHHLLPCEFRVYMGYIPVGGKVIGLSKLARLADILARRPIMQEEYTSELASLLQEKLSPKGVGVTVFGIHGCMVCRGVKQHAEVVTSVMRGDFLKEGPTRAEFLAFCRDKE